MNKKIAVIGIGGIGGYVGALLAEKYDDVTLVARGARKELLEKEGLVLHSEYRGEHVIKPVKVVASSLEIFIPKIVGILKLSPSNKITHLGIESKQII